MASVHYRLRALTVVYRKRGLLTTPTEEEWELAVETEVSTWDTRLFVAVSPPKNSFSYLTKKKEPRCPLQSLQCAVMMKRTWNHPILGSWDVARGYWERAWEFPPPRKPPFHTAVPEWIEVTYIRAYGTHRSGIKVELALSNLCPPGLGRSCGSD